MSFYFNIIFGIFASSYPPDLLDSKLDEVNGFGVNGYVQNACIEHYDNYKSSKEGLW